MTAVLSIDVGTTALKGVLFNASGHTLATDLREYELLKPAPDVVECDPELYWNATKAVIRNLLKESRVEARRIRSVGITSQGETLIVVDVSGRTLRPAIVWLDNRSQAEADEVGGHFDIDDAYRITGQQEMAATWTATKILWLRKHESDLFRQVRKFLLVEDYLFYRLTGQYISDCGLNPSTLYFDIRSDRWWPEMLQFLEISEAQLPNLKHSGQFSCPITVEAADQTGLSRDTVVTTAPIDQIAGAIGAGNFERGIVSETTGAVLAICATSDQPTYDPERRLPCHTHGVEGKYALLAWAPTAGMALRWFRDEFGGSADYPTLCNQSRQITAGADGLIFLPYLAGAGCPEMIPKARGVFWGITMGHRKAHFIRAILESIAFLLRRNVEYLEAFGIPVVEVRSLGGGARSEYWLQIKADMLNKPCLVMECDEAASLGVAMLSCVANGIYRDLSEARDNMVRVTKQILPNSANTRALDDVYHRYLSLHNRAKDVFSQT